jgi:hypothetical protein
MPILPFVVGGALGLVLIAFGVIAYLNPGASADVHGIKCEAGEQLGYHIHAHLTIIQDGQERNVPAQIGVKDTCLYWLHTHDETGVIHIEAPASQKNHTYTLGDFFDVWAKSNSGIKLDSKHVATFTVAPDQQLVMYVDGQPYTGDPRKIELKNHTQVVLVIQPPPLDRPPTYTFPPNL